MTSPNVCDDHLDDIEDIILSENDNIRERIISPRIRIKPKKNKNDPNEKNGNSNDPLNNTPACNHSIYIKTWGCAHNSSDSEYMAGQLAAYGYRLTQNKAEADLWLLNSCTVKNPAEDHFRNEIDLAKTMEKKIVVAGCVPQGAPKAAFVQNLSVVGVQQIDRVVEVVEETLKGHSVRLLGIKKSEGKKIGGASLLLPKVRKNPLIEIIAINTGCLNQCSYCKTKHARGDLGSYPPEEIVERAKQAFEEGVVEIWLTSEDTGTYGRDIGTSLPELLWKLVEVIPDGCRLRLGMTNPPYILEHLGAIADIMRHPRVYSFLHVPVQSGSDSVLADMKREYCIEDFEEVVTFLQTRVPGMTIATDIICGYPTETEEDFEQTMALCEKHKFPSLFINQFFPRPGTVAARLPRIPPQDVKKRTKRLTDLFYMYEPYTHKLGQIQEVLVTEVSHDRQHYVGHNEFYEQVLVPMEEKFMGKIVKVEIVKTTKFSMIGEPITNKVKSPGLAEPLKKGQVSGVSNGVTFSDKRLLLSLFVLGFSILIKWFFFNL